MGVNLPLGEVEDGADNWVAHAPAALVGGVEVQLVAGGVGPAVGPPLDEAGGAGLREPAAGVGVEVPQDMVEAAGGGALRRGEGREGVSGLGLGIGFG